MRPGSIFIAAASMALSLPSFPADSSQVAETAESAQSEEITIHPTLEKALREQNPAPLKPGRPIRKLVIETKVKSNVGSETTTLYDCHYEYAEYGVVLRACEKQWDKAKELITSEVLFMGLTPPLASSSGLKGDYSIVTTTRAFITTWRHHYRVQSKSKLVRWDAVLSSIAHPSPSQGWKDSYTIAREAATSGFTTSKKLLTLSATRHCTVGQTIPASSVAPSLIGEAVQVECNSSGDASSSNHWLLLMESGLYFQLRANSSAVEVNSRIVEAEYY